MKLLCLESSARAASCALLTDGELTGQYWQNCALTHSRTLLSMAEALLNNLDMTMEDVDALAVANGPGSFTGIRIGVAAVKGLAWGADKPAVAVSTLEAMACHLCDREGALVCPAMDARRSQVYNALFRIQDGSPVRLTEDRAISLEELTQEVLRYGESVYVLGDGEHLAREAFQKAGIPLSPVPPTLLLQSAWGVGIAAQGRVPENAADISPNYLRLSQAERERNERLAREAAKTV